MAAKSANVDFDNDGYRPASGTATITSLDVDCNGDGEAEDGEPTGDCNDSMATIRPGVTELVGDDVDQNCDGEELCYVDDDNDGFRPGDGSATVTSLDIDCGGDGEARTGEPTGDCDDVVATVFPGAVEGVDDGVDQDCNGFELCYEDVDNDGYRPDAVTTVASANLVCTDSGEAEAGDPIDDCDDNDPARFPTNPEICDNKDNDCNGPVDDNGAGGPLTQVCYEGDPLTRNVGLCRDGTQTCTGGIFGSCDGQVTPTDEICDTEDNDCDNTDDEETTTQDWYVDFDIDGFGDPDSTPINSCAPIGGRAPNSGDCNDGDGNINPDATEIVGDGTDQNCDERELCYVDGDEDNYHDGVTVLSTNYTCNGMFELPGGAPGNDCDDTTDLINPGVSEIVGDEFDQNCNGQEVCYADADNDGYRPGTGTATVVSNNLSCQNDGEAQDFEPTGDCADADPTRNPGEAEGIADNVDQDCDGVELCYVDADDDGYRAGDGTGTVDSPNLACTDAGEAVGSDPINDCLDTDADVNPGASEVCDWFDTDCSGGSSNPNDPAEQDPDGDRWLACSGYIDHGALSGGLPISGGGDCLDTNAAVNPGASEICDGWDTDCSSGTSTPADTDELDDDNDRYIECSGFSGSGAENGLGETILGGGDCNDTTTLQNPGETDVCDGIDNDCSGSLAADEDDTDLDRYIGCAGFVDHAATNGGGLTILGGNDCNEGHDFINPGEVEICDGWDNDCSGSVSADETDSDLDQYITCSPFTDNGAQNGNAEAILGGADCSPSDGAIRVRAPVRVGSEGESVRDRFTSAIPLWAGRPAASRFAWRIRAHRNFAATLAAGAARRGCGARPVAAPVGRSRAGFDPTERGRRRRRCGGSWVRSRPGSAQGRPGNRARRRLCSRRVLDPPTRFGC